jgi:pimeloyl-ACP methyl ester carboxylesterase
MTAKYMHPGAGRQGNGVDGGNDERKFMIESLVSIRNGLFRTFVRTEGDGDTLLFLHGADGLGGWPRFLGSLARKFRVIAPDHPGFGRSEGLEHVDDVVDLALYYTEFIAAMGLDQPYLMGHSLGGMIAAEVAAIAPDVASKLVLIAPLGLWLDDHPVMDFFAATAEELATAMFHDPGSAIAKEMMTLPPDREGQLEAVLERTKNLSAAGKFLWPIPDKGLQKRIHRIAAPTLLLWGASDRLVPPIYGEAFLTRIQRARLTLLTGAGHMLPFEKGDELVEVVTDFLLAQ